jgi:Ca2+-binding EF-hand superfamily protein
MTARIHAGVAVAALFAATMATAAFAERGPGGSEGRGGMMLEMFDSIDADKDGKLTEAELQAHRAAEFATADANSDGVLSAEELTAKHLARLTEMAADRTTRMIDNLDENGDGSLSAEEMDPSVRERGFARMDRDDDGAISKEEAEAALERFADGRKHHRRGMGEGMEN